MSDTTATVRAEILEEKKREINSEISALRAIRENYEPNHVQYIMADALIDELLVKKDNLSADVPAGWIDPAAHEIAALEKMRADFLATNDKYLHQRAERIVAQIASIREASAQTV